MHTRAEAQRGTGDLGARRGPCRVTRPVAGALLAAWALLAVASPALAEEPSSFNRAPRFEKLGWWNRAQQLPPESGEVPPPPGAPEHGIYVAQDISSTAAAPDGAPSEPTPTPAPTPAPGPPALGPVPTPPAAPAPASHPTSQSSSAQSSSAQSGRAESDAGNPQPESSSPARPEPAAIGAVRFAVPAGAAALLTLQVQRGSTAGGTILACPVRSQWVPATNGRWDAKPNFTCAKSAKGRAQGKEALVFELPASLQTEPGAFDLALVPRGSTPFEVAFHPATDDSLVVTLAADTRPGTKEALAATAIDDAGAPVRGPAPMFRDSRTTLSPGAAALLIGDTEPATLLDAVDPSQLPAEAEEPRVLGVVRELQTQTTANDPAFIAGGVVLLALGSFLLWLVRTAGRRTSIA